MRSPSLKVSPPTVKRWPIAAFDGRLLRPHRRRMPDSCAGPGDGPGRETGRSLHRPDRIRRRRGLEPGRIPAGDLEHRPVRRGRARPRHRTRAAITIVDTSGREVACLSRTREIVRRGADSWPSRRTADELVGTRSEIPVLRPVLRGADHVGTGESGRVSHGRSRRAAYAARLSPAEDLVASTPEEFGTGGQAAELWEWPSGRHHRTLAGHSGAVTEAVFSPDGLPPGDGEQRRHDPAVGPGRRRATACPPGPRRACRLGRLQPGRSAPGVGGGRRHRPGVGAHARRAGRRGARGGLTRGLTDDECRQYLHVESCRPG